MEASAFKWLLEQSPVIIVLGVVIWWLAARFTKKDSELKDLSKEVIKLVAMWEAKSEALSAERGKFATILDGMSTQHKEGYDNLQDKLKVISNYLEEILKNQKNSENSELRAIKQRLDDLIGQK